MFHGFSKPQNKFIRDKHRNVENRLSRNLQAEGLHEKIRDAIQADAVRAVDRATDGRGIRVYDRGGAG